MMGYGTTCGVVSGTTSVLILLLLGGMAAAQRPAESQKKFKNIELCNGANRNSPDIRIEGCTAVIESGKETPKILVIAYNNRGNAYTAKGEYDRAVQDYDQSIKLNPNYAKALNNRGVAYQKRVTTIGRSKTLMMQSSSIPTMPAPLQTAPKLT
jgi:tetratricopeptide (TPR) repeat protein